MGERHGLGDGGFLVSHIQWPFNGSSVLKKAVGHSRIYIALDARLLEIKPFMNYDEL
jgi:hypothetical protein